MTEDAAAAAACPRCRGPHPLVECPHVKALEYEDGDPRLIRRVEFLTPADYGPAPPAAPAEPAPASGPRDYPRLGEQR